MILTFVLKPTLEVLKLSPEFRYHPNRERKGRWAAQISPLYQSPFFNLSSLDCFRAARFSNTFSNPPRTRASILLRASSFDQACSASVRLADKWRCPWTWCGFRLIMCFFISALVLNACIMAWALERCCCHSRSLGMLPSSFSSNSSAARGTRRRWCSALALALA